MSARWKAQQDREDVRIGLLATLVQSFGAKSKHDVLQPHEWFKATPVEEKVQKDFDVAVKKLTDIYRGTK